MHFNLFDCLLALVVDHSLFLEVLDLPLVNKISEPRFFRLVEKFKPLLPQKLLQKVGHVYHSQDQDCVPTHPAVCTILLKLFVELSAETCSLVPPRLCVYAVQDVVLVEAFEEGVSCCVALLAV